MARRYIALPITRDPVEAEEQSFEVIRGQWADWRPADADPMTQMLRAAAVMYADLGELATRMSEEAFRYFGRGIVDLPPVDDSPATGTVLVTARDGNGPYLVPEGLEVGGRSPDTGELVGFRTVAPQIIPNGATTIEVAVEATEDGTGSNGITGPAEFLEFVDYLEAVEFVGETSSGDDRESDEAYLDRLAGELELQAPRPILPRDFALLAQRLAGPGYLATAIDGLDPADGTTGHERMVAVALKDSDGQAVGADVKTAVRTGLEAMREQNFEVPVFDPDYTTVGADYTATALPGWDPAAVKIAADAQIASYLFGGTWGQREDTGERREWRNVALVRWGEVYERLQRVEGLEFVDALTLSKDGVPLASGANVVLDGLAPLPVAGVIDGTVTPAVDA